MEESMTRPHELTRRSTLRGAAALAVATVGTGTVSTPAHADEAYLMDLWQRFVEAELGFGDAVRAEGDASFAAGQEVRTLPAVETRVYSAKVGWIRRRSRVVDLENAVEAASDYCADVRREIAAAPINCPLAAAIKLAVWAHGENWTAERIAALDLDGECCLDRIEEVALWSVYQGAVAACGYDPLAEAYEAQNKARAERAAVVMP